MSKSGFIAAIMALAILVLLALMINSFINYISAKYVINKTPTNSYIKKDDCVEFTDIYGKDSKICGAYTIRERNFQK